MTEQARAEQSGGNEYIHIYARAIAEIQDAQDAYTANPSEKAFGRFWIARERYQALTRKIASHMLTVDAEEAYRS